ncbi:ABC transporter substrate-binding protein, partial [Patescibacteria group bacterium]
QLEPDPIKKRSYIPFKRMRKKSKKNEYNDQKLISTLRKNKYPKIKQLKYLLRILSIKEKKYLLFLSTTILCCLIFIGIIYCKNHIETVPSNTGEYITGIIGYPQLINPLFAQTNTVDSDLTKLTFSGLLKYDKDLNLIPDLAVDYTISEDQTIYTFNLRQDILWQKNGDKFTADDIVFTIETIKNPEYKSSLYRTFKSIEVTKINDYIVEFKLQEPYSPFLNILTLGILPQNIWCTVPPQNASLAQYNLKPIGTGMFEFNALTKDKIGNIKSYTLIRNENYYSKKPYLQKITFKFFPDAESALFALKSKEIQGINFLPKNLKSDLADNNNIFIKSLSMPQYTSIFFNQEHNEVLKKIEMRKAITFAINKQEILDKDLSNDGMVIDGPILPGYIGYNPDLQKYEYNPQEANKLLDDMEWGKISSEEIIKIEKEKIDKEIEAQHKKLEGIKKEEEGSEENIIHINGLIDELKQQIDNLSEYNLQTFYRKKDDKVLTLNLTTVNNENNLKVSNGVIKYWKDLGILTKLTIIEPVDVEKEILKTRNYDCLLYGEIMGSDPDPYPFWHSSQNQYPGLNLSVFSNKEVDKLLEEARQTNDLQKRKDKYVHFQNIIVKELPAIFLYSPTHTYILSSEVKGFDISRIYLPQDRFNNIEEWYTETKRVWVWGN